MNTTPSAQEEVQKEVLPGYPWPIHTRRKVPREHDWQRSNRRSLSPNGWPCGRRPHPPFNLTITRVNWWIRSNKIGSDTMPIPHRPDFKQALSTLRQFKDKKMKLNATKVGAKLFFVLVELARIMVTFFLWASPRRRTQHRSIRETWQKKNWDTSRHDFPELTCFVTVGSFTADGGLL